MNIYKINHKATETLERMQDTKSHQMLKPQNEQHVSKINCKK